MRYLSHWTRAVIIACLLLAIIGNVLHLLSLAPATLVTRCSETTGAMIAAVVAAASAVDAVVEVSDAAAASQLSCARRMLARRSEESRGGKSPPGFRSGPTSPDTGAGARDDDGEGQGDATEVCLLYTSPSPRDGLLSRMPSSA